MDIFLAAFWIVLAWLDVAVSDANTFDQNSLIFGVNLQDFTSRAFILTSNDFYGVIFVNTSP